MVAPLGLAPERDRFLILENPIAFYQEVQLTVTDVFQKRSLKAFQSSRVHGKGIKKKLPKRQLPLLAMPRRPASS